MREHLRLAAAVKHPADPELIGKVTEAALRIR
jgi:hypothetical protein